MDGLSLLGADSATLKKNAPYIGAAVGALGGALLLYFTGKHTHNRAFLRLGGSALLFGSRVPRLARVGLGAAAGAAAGGLAGYGVKKKG